MGEPRASGTEIPRALGKILPRHSREGKSSLETWEKSGMLGLKSHFSALWDEEEFSSQWGHSRLLSGNKGKVGNSVALDLWNSCWGSWRLLG